MKTIRQNTFETNSSSTHSITIINRSDFREEEGLYVDGVLYPSKIKISKEYGYGGERQIYKASTIRQKMALLVQWMKDAVYGVYCDEWNEGQPDADAVWKQFVEFIETNYCKLDSEINGMDIFSEGEFDFRLSIWNWSKEELDTTKIKKFIDDYVLNPDVIIEDVYESN